MRGSSPVIGARSAGAKLPTTTTTTTTTTTATRTTTATAKDKTTKTATRQGRCGEEDEFSSDATSTALKQPGSEECAAARGHGIASCRKPSEQIDIPKGMGVTGLMSQQLK
mmetsp:Transcript_16919/g.33028  ORF Transcript_16919/g.33028 Transcript_16919/m.33028 type:complete len:111 (+) Transcript_16919:392-724(+)